MCFRVVKLDQGLNGLGMLQLNASKINKIPSILLFDFMPLRLPGHAHVSEFTTLAVNYMNLQLFSTCISCFYCYVLENNEKWLQEISNQSGTISYISRNMIKMMQTFKHSKPFFCE